MLASSFVEDLDDRVLECTVCMKRLRQPKTLPCLHSFCQHCLEDWVKTKEHPTCPTCMENFDVPSGGLQSIPPNTVVNNLLEYVSHLEDGVVRCAYCNQEAVKFCKNCSQNFCTDCIKSHSIVDVLKSHSLLLVEDIKGLTPEQRGLLKSSHCKTHTTQSLKFFCNRCNVPICVECIIIKHKRCHNDDHVIDISKAFTEFQKVASELIDKGERYELEISNEKTKVQNRASHLEMEGIFCEVGIDKSVDEAVRKLENRRTELKASLMEMYTERKQNLTEITDKMDAISNSFSHIKRVAGLSIQSSDPGAALESKEQILDKLREAVTSCASFPHLDDTHNAILHFDKMEPPAVNDIGHVTHTNNLYKTFKLQRDCDKLIVTKHQPFGVIISAPVPDKEGDILAMLSSDSGQEISVKFQYDGDGVYKTQCRCPEPGIWNLQAKVNDINIEDSPMEIVVEKNGLVRTIDGFANLELSDNKEGKVTDIILDEEGYMLVARNSREVLKFDHKTGEYVDKIVVPMGSWVYTVSKVKGGDLLLYSDTKKRCVTLCRRDGTTVRSFGKGVIAFAVGISFDEVTRILYVADRNAHCVLKFNFDNGELIEKIGSEGKDLGYFNRPYHLVVRDDGVIVNDCKNSRLQILDKNTNIWSVFVELTKIDIILKAPLGIVIDKEYNIIVSGFKKVLMFDACGKFIKRIDSDADNTDVPIGLAVVSDRPRRVAIGSYNTDTVKIYNY